MERSLCPFSVEILPIVATPVLLPGKSHGWRSLVGCSPWGQEESDTAERLPFHFSLSCIGEGNGNPLQCSCLENPQDGGAWWASDYGVAQSWTRLKRLSSTIVRSGELGLEQYKLYLALILITLNLLIRSGFSSFQLIFVVVFIISEKENKQTTIRSDQIRSVTQSCRTLCDPMNRSTPGLPVHHQLPEFTETHIHRVITNGFFRELKQKITIHMKTQKKKQS